MECTVVPDFEGKRFISQIVSNIKTDYRWESNSYKRNNLIEGRSFFACLW